MGGSTRMNRHVVTVGLIALAIVALAGIGLLGGAFAFFGLASREASGMNEPVVVSGELTEPQPDDDGGIEAFVGALKAAGVAAEAGTMLIEQPFFSVPGRIVTVWGQEVQVFEYADGAAAQAEAALIAPDASSVGTSMMTWIDTPHFYQSDNLIVLYVGNDIRVQEALADVLGDPVAEGQASPPVSFEAATYRNESAGFELDYPATWTYVEDIYGDRGSGAQFTSSGEIVMSATVYLWDPTNDLDAFVAVRKQAWSASGTTIVSEEEISLAGDHRAIRFVIQTQVGEQAFIMFTTIGERYLELAGSGDLNLLAEIAGTVRMVGSGS